MFLGDTYLMNKHEQPLSLEGTQNSLEFVRIHCNSLRDSRYIHTTYMPITPILSMYVHVCVCNGTMSVYADDYIKAAHLLKYTVYVRIRVY